MENPDLNLLLEEKGDYNWRVLEADNTIMNQKVRSTMLLQVENKGNSRKTFNIVK